MKPSAVKFDISLIPRSRSRNGFTLIELLVVIVIIGILAGLSVAIIPGVISSQKITRAEGEMKIIAQALEQYKNRYYDYPAYNSANPEWLTEALCGFKDSDGDWKIRVPKRINGAVTMSDPKCLVPDIPLIGDQLQISLVNGKQRIVDPWGEPYEYRYATEADMSNPLKSRTWKYSGFILYSKGNDNLGTLDIKGTESDMAKAVQEHFHNSNGEHYDDLIEGFSIQDQ